MKRFIITALCVLLIASLVGCDWQSYLPWHETESTTNTTTRRSANSTASTRQSKTTQSTRAPITIPEPDMGPITIELQELFSIETISKIGVRFGKTDDIISRVIKNKEKFYNRFLNGIVLTNDATEIERAYAEIYEFLDENPYERGEDYSLTMFDMENNVLGFVSVWPNGIVSVTYLVTDMTFVGLPGYYIDRDDIYFFWCDEDKENT